MRLLHDLRRVCSSIVLLCGLWLTTATSPASELPPIQTAPGTSLADLSLEQLANIEVTSVSKRPEKLQEAATAVHVITGEDIRRFGATSIPEALRLAPGVFVGRVDAHTWAVSARGFPDVFANKMLVLMDGRSVYTPLFSGVYWDVQDTLLEDLNHIEVIRGPGATLWGANAVNGVINITTKSAKETQGALVSTGYGSEEQGFVSARYGGKLGSNTWARVYGKYFNRDDSVLPSGEDANDRWMMGQGGFRTDWEPAQESLFTFQGDLYSGVEHQTQRIPVLSPAMVRYDEDPVRVNGGNLLGRWTRTFSPDSELKLQAYYDHTSRETDYLGAVHDTVDFEGQHRIALGRWNEIIWGAGYRMSHDDLRGSFAISFDPPSRNDQLVNVFAQDEITLVPDHLRFTLGCKVEHNDYTGFEIQPGGRLLWEPNDRHSFWASVARATRTPSRAESDGRLYDQVIWRTPPILVGGIGNSDLESEELLAYELGYRVQFHKRVSTDLALFYNDYNQLSQFRYQYPAWPHGVLEDTPPPTHLWSPVVFDDVLEGESYGGEVALNYQLTDWWLWRASYSYCNVDLAPLSNADGTTSTYHEGTTPRHQVCVRSLVDLPHNIQLDVTGRYVDELPAFQIPSYFTMDVRIGWRPRANLELTLVGQNLLDDRHPESSPSIIRTQQTEVERSVYGKVTWRF